VVWYGAHWGHDHFDAPQRSDGPNVHGPDLILQKYKQRGGIQSTLTEGGEAGEGSRPRPSVFIARTTLERTHTRSHRPVEAMAKILDRQELIRKREELRGQGRALVFTNGCFDLLHPGHVRYLAEARALGDALVVALNSDRSVRVLKGEGRPILNEEERAEVVAALQAVDYVIIFDEATPRELIAELLPDVLVKGGDWPLDEIVGRQEVEAAGGKVMSLPYFEGSSTTDIIDRIKSLSS